MTLEQLKEHLRAITVSHGFTTNYDAWNESRKALAHEILGMLSHISQPAQSVDVWAIREVIGDMDASSINDHIIDVWTDKLTRAIGNAQTIADSVDSLVVRLGEVTARLEAAEKDAQFLRSHRPIARKLEAANALLREFTGAVIETAFKMPAPNSWTPVFVQMAQQAQRRADQIDTHLSETRT